MPGKGVHRLAYVDDLGVAHVDGVPEDHAAIEATGDEASGHATERQGGDPVQHGLAPQVGIAEQRLHDRGHIGDAVGDDEDRRRQSFPDRQLAQHHDENESQGAARTIRIDRDELGHHTDDVEVGSLSTDERLLGFGDDDRRVGIGELARDVSSRQRIVADHDGHRQPRHRDHLDSERSSAVPDHPASPRTTVTAWFTIRRRVARNESDS